MVDAQRRKAPPLPVPPLLLRFSPSVVVAMLYLRGGCALGLGSLFSQSLEDHLQERITFEVR